MLKEFYKNEDGQGMVEYGLIIALISIVAIAILGTLGGKISEVFTRANNEMSNAMGGNNGGNAGGNN